MDASVVSKSVVTETVCLTCQNCTKVVDNLKIVLGLDSKDKNNKEFSVPMIGCSLMMTMGLTPALFPTGVTPTNNKFDTGLSSSWIWEEQQG